MNIDIDSIAISSVQIQGNVSGVYFLFDKDEVVYIGQGWNCFLRVAEHTRKDANKTFTHWWFIDIQSEVERKVVEKELIRKYQPRFNRRP